MQSLVLRLKDIHVDSARTYETGPFSRTVKNLDGVEDLLQESEASVTPELFGREKPELKSEQPLAREIEMFKRPRQPLGKVPSLAIPTFKGVKFNEWASQFATWGRIIGFSLMTEDLKKDWIVMAMSETFRPTVMRIARKSETSCALIRSLASVYPERTNNWSIRQALKEIKGLKGEFDSKDVELLLQSIDLLLGDLTGDTMSEEDKVLLLCEKIPDKEFKEIRSHPARRLRMVTYNGIADLLREVADETEMDRLIMKQRKSTVSSTLLAMPVSDSDKRYRGKPDKSEGVISKMKVSCHFCGKTGHYTADCWTENPEKRPDWLKKKLARMGRPQVKVKRTEAGGDSKKANDSTKSAVEQPKKVEPNVRETRETTQKKRKLGETVLLLWETGSSSVEKVSQQRAISKTLCNERIVQSESDIMERKSTPRPRKVFVLPNAASCSKRVSCDPRNLGGTSQPLKTFSPEEQLCVSVSSEPQVFSVKGTVAGQAGVILIDTCASMEGCIALHLYESIAQTYPMCRGGKTINLGDGRVAWAEGEVVMPIQLGDVLMDINFTVLDTTAFEYLLGVPFLDKTETLGILLKPYARLVFTNDREVRMVRQKSSECSISALGGNLEGYKLHPNIRGQLLTDLDMECCIDLFASYENRSEDLFISEENDAFSYSWTRLSSEINVNTKRDIALWANPPFSQLSSVVAKVMINPCLIVVCAPEWPSEEWYTTLKEITCKQTSAPRDAKVTYIGDRTGPLPSPSWDTTLHLIDTRLNKSVNGRVRETDVSVLKHWKVDKKKLYQGTKGLEDLKQFLRERRTSNTKETGTSTDMDDELTMEGTFAGGTTNAALGGSLPLNPAALANWESQDPIAEWKTSQPLLFIDGEYQKDERPWKPANREFELEVLEILLQMVDEEAVPSTLHGEKISEESLKRHHPDIRPLLQEFEEVFGELQFNNYWTGVRPVEFALRKEHEHDLVKARGYALNPADEMEMERQIQELLKKGVIENVPEGTFPQVVSPAFLVPKKSVSSEPNKPRAKRMCIAYQKVNAMMKHIGYNLPLCESIVERIARCPIKCTLDLRSGFWQMPLGPVAKSLSTFITPRQQIYQWTRLPFGLADAPGAFQLEMSRLRGEFLNQEAVRQLMREDENLCVENMIDDFILGSSTEKFMIRLLIEWFNFGIQKRLRFNLEKCEFLKKELVILGFHVGVGWFKPAQDKVDSLVNKVINTQTDLRSFLGIYNFVRRHFKVGTAIQELTHLLRKNCKWEWTQKEQDAVNLIRKAITDATGITTPIRGTDMILITDSCQFGGGGTLYQWQPKDLYTIQASADKRTIPTKANCKGEFTPERPDDELKCLGHWSWTWSSCQKNYSVYEQELLAGILLLGACTRIISMANSLSWLCDQIGTVSFITQEPPQNPRRLRWWSFCQTLPVPLFVSHIPGIYNELSDALSRASYDVKMINMGKEVFESAQLHFREMDERLDFGDLLFMDIVEETKFSLKDYENTELPVEVLNLLAEKKDMVVFISKVHWSTEHTPNGIFLYREGKLTVPRPHLQKWIEWVHTHLGHPTVNQSLLWFSKRFHYPNQEELRGSIEKYTKMCETCLRTRPNTQSDRGLASGLPIPSICNQTVLLDFVEMPETDKKNMILVVSDSLSTFIQCYPCEKTISSEGVIKTLWENWIATYGLPGCFCSDADVRMKSETSWYSSLLRSYGVEVKLSIPYHKTSHGKCERRNRDLVGILRRLTTQMSAENWIKVLPIAVVLLNDTPIPILGYSPSEMFLGRESRVGQPFGYNPRFSPAGFEPWIERQNNFAAQTEKWLQNKRSEQVQRKNKHKCESKIKVGDYVLVHHTRWGLAGRDNKIQEDWVGPFRVLKRSLTSVIVKASPRLGGKLTASLQLCKLWPKVVNNAVQYDEEGKPLPEAIRTTRLERQADPFEIFELPPPDEEGFFKVSHIVSHRKAKKQSLEFLTQWEGFNANENTWEPEEAFIFGETITKAMLEYIQLHSMTSLYNRMLAKIDINKGIL